MADIRTPCGIRQNGLGTGRSLRVAPRSAGRDFSSVRDNLPIGRFQLISDVPFKQSWIASAANNISSKSLLQPRVRAVCMRMKLQKFLFEG